MIAVLLDDPQMVASYNRRASGTEAALREQQHAWLKKALQRSLAVLCKSGHLNNHRHLTDNELGRLWIATAREAGALLNEIDGLPFDPADIASLKRAALSPHAKEDLNAKG